MLNCFYGYSVVWTLILLLYSFNFTAFNKKLDNFLSLFIIVTIILSFVIGYANKKKFKFKKTAVDYGLKPIIIIVILFICNFIYAKSIPLLTIIRGSSLYGDFNSIPYLYVLLNAIAFYYGINYFNAYLNISENKKRNLICFLLINLMYLFAFSRSTIIFLCIGAFILYIMSKKNMSLEKIKTKKSYLFLIIVFSFIVIYGFGVLGNIRSGYKYNDNSYIERIGLYNKFPKFLPKQFMWTYSYLTSPLANLNDNVKNNKNIDFNLKKIFSELINRTIAKRIFPDLQYGEEAVLKVGIRREYFNAVTGYFLMYTYGGMFGMIVQYFVLVTVSYIQILMLNNKKNSGKENGTYIILLLANTLMFFYNSLNTTTISWWLIVNFVALCNKPKMKGKFYHD